MFIPLKRNLSVILSFQIHGNYSWHAYTQEMEVANIFRFHAHPINISKPRVLIKESAGNTKVPWYRRLISWGFTEQFLLGKMVSLPRLRKVYFEWCNGDIKDTKEHILLVMVEFQLKGQAGSVNDVRAQRSCRKIMNALSVQGAKERSALCHEMCSVCFHFTRHLCGLACVNSSSHKMKNPVGIKKPEWNCDRLERASESLFFQWLFFYLLCSASRQACEPSTLTMPFRSKRIIRNTHSWEWHPLISQVFYYDLQTVPVCYYSQEKENGTVP